MRNIMYHLPVLMIACAVLMPPAASAEACWEQFVDRNDIIDIVFTGEEPWTLTTGGIVRWAGKSMIPVEIDAPFTASALVSDDSGRLWAADLQNLYIRENGAWEPVEYGGGEYTVIETLVGGHGLLCLGTREGLFVYDGTSWRSYTTADGLPYQRVISVAIGADGGIYTGTISGAVYKPAMQLPDGQTNNPAEKPSGDPSYTAAISMLDDGNWTTIKEFPSSQVLIGAYVAVASNGNLFAWQSCMYDSFAEGIHYFDGTGWRMVDTGAGLPSNSIRTVFAEPGNSGTIWIATDGGLCRYTDRVEKVYTTNDGLSNRQVNTLAYSSDGVLYAGTERGFCVFDGTTWMAHYVPGIVSNYVLHIKGAPGGGVWFGTDRGVSRYENGAWTSWPLETGDGGRFDHLDVDSRGRMWILSGGTLFTVEDDTMRTVKTGCVDFAIDENDRIWIHADKKIYMRDDHGEHMILETHLQFSNDRVWFCSVPDGSVWIITGSDGNIYLYRYTTALSRPVIKENVALSGLAHVSCDNSGTVWFVNDRSSVFRWSGEAWDGWLRDEIFTETGSGRASYIVHAPDGSHWCMGSRYARLVDGAWTRPSPDEGAPLRVNGITFDSAGNAWFPITNNGTAQFVDGHWNTYESVTGSLLPGDNGRMWVINREGFSVFDEEEWTIYPYGPVTDMGNPLAIAIDAHENIWYTAPGVGVVRFSLNGTGIEEETVPRATALNVQAFPNPFNGAVTIRFIVPGNGPVTVDVYSLSGQKIRTCLSRPMTAGRYSTIWDGRDNGGKRVSSGLYFARVSVGGMMGVTRMMLIK